MNDLENVKVGDKVVAIKYGFGCLPSEHTYTVTSITPKLLVCKWGNDAQYATRINKETAKEYGGECHYNHSSYFPETHQTVIELHAKKFELMKFNTLKEGITTAIKNSSCRAGLLASLEMILEMEKGS
jgi:hypothetical protein